MNSFRVSRIRKRRPFFAPKKTPSEEHKRKKLRIALGRPLKIVLLIAVGVFLLWHVPQQLLRFIEKPLAHDENDHTNILLLGVGGLGHEGPNLTDTVMIASIDLREPSIAFFSIPRDIFLKTKALGSVRLNAIYELANKEKNGEALTIFKESVEELMHIPIHYAVKVDFTAFKKVVDSVGGIDVTLAAPFADPFYPKEETEGFEPLFLAQGAHHLDGEMALKLARSRKTSSDFDRSLRQQMILEALQKKALSVQILGNPRRIAQIFDIVRDHIEADVSLRQMLSLADIATKLPRNGFHTAVIHDDPSKEGGFLYVPPREQYGGAFVLLPQRDTWDEIRLYAHAALYDAHLLKEKTPIQILNGTGTPNLAATVKAHLTRYGLSVIRFGNGRQKHVAQTAIYYKDEKEPALMEFLKTLLPGATVKSHIPKEYLVAPYASEAAIVVELGQDEADIMAKLPPYYASVYVPAETPSAQSASPIETKTSPQKTPPLTHVR